MEKILVVGGYARDTYLGRESKDMDFVVVGMTEEGFIKLYPNAQKVGKKFPCFKVGSEDYAFARIEKSTGPGTNDFETASHPKVTLEEDLNRRDLTINTACICPETGEFFLLDRAKADLDQGVLRHVSDAFSEDPLRVFRLARFAAKFQHFTIAPETIDMCRSMTYMLSFLDKERVAFELLSALKEPAPHKFFWTLKISNALGYWFKELHDLKMVPAGPEEYHSEPNTFIHSVQVLDRVSRMTYSPTTRWAAMCHDLGKACTPSEEWPAHHRHDRKGTSQLLELANRIGLPLKFKRAATIACEEHMRFNKLCEMKPGKAVELLTRINKFPGGVEEFIKLVKADGIKPGVEELARAAQAIFVLKLPKKHRNRGEISRAVLLEMRGRAFKTIKKELA